MITTVDIGATKTLIGQFTNAGILKTQVKFLTNPNFSIFFDELTHHLDAITPLSQLSVAAPCQAEDGVIKKCGNLPWVDAPLSYLLMKRYNCPVILENDASMAAIGEINAIKPLPHIGVYLTVSTGIGAGIVIDGKLVNNPNPEPGHMMFESEGKLKEWEDIASGRAIHDRFGKFASELSSPQEINWVADRLTIGLRVLIPLIQPDVIVIGGGASSAFDKFYPALVQKLRVALPDYIDLPEIVKAKHPQEAVIYGAYYHATHKSDVR